MSNSRRAVPTISAASATVARSSTVSSASATSGCAGAVDDPEPASTSNTRREKSTVPTRRTGGDWVSVTTGPDNTTATQSTRSAPGTNVFTGSSFGCHTPSAPATATVPVTSPASTDGTRSWPSAPSNGANSATVEKNGPGAAT